MCGIHLYNIIVLIFKLKELNLSQESIIFCFLENTAFWSFILTNPNYVFSLRTLKIPF